MSEYYTASKAEEVLGNISYSELSRYVISGRIRKKVPPGKKQGIYNKDDVDSLAREIDQFRKETRIHSKGQN